MEITPLGTLLERRKAWIQIRPDILWSLKWVQTVQLNRFLQAKTINSGPDNQKLNQIHVVPLPWHWLVSIRGIASTHKWNRLNIFLKKGAYTRTNNEDPDETPQNVASHHGLCCLPRNTHSR